MNPTRQITGRAILLWLLVLLLSTMSPYKSWSLLAAWSLSTALTLCLIALKPVRSFLTGLPKSDQWMIAVFFFLFAAGHHFPGMRREVIFPFVPWNMFSAKHEGNRVFFYEYTGIDRDGNRRLLNPAKYFPPMRHARLTAALWVQLPPHDQKLELDGKHSKIRDLLTAIARAYNRRDTARPIVMVEIARCAIDLQEKQVPAVARETIGQIKL